MSEEYGLKFVVNGEDYDKIKKSLNEQIEDLQQKVKQLENENFNIRENIHLERISLPPELTKDKNFMELYDIPSYKDLQQKVDQLEKENIKQKEIIENLTTMTVCGDKKQIKNTAQYKLEELEKENEYLKMSNPEQNMEHFRIVNENKRKIDMLRKENHQLENIRKEVIESIKEYKSNNYSVFSENEIEIDLINNLLNILNKGE